MHEALDLGRKLHKPLDQQGLSRASLKLMPADVDTWKRVLKRLSFFQGIVHEVALDLGECAQRGVRFRVLCEEAAGLGWRCARDGEWGE